MRSGVLGRVEPDPLEEAAEVVGAAGDESHLRNVALGALGRQAGGRRPGDDLLSVQAFTCGRKTSRRHFPICTTRGTCVVAGTPVSVNVPLAFDVVAVT